MKCWIIFIFYVFFNSLAFALEVDPVEAQLELAYLNKERLIEKKAKENAKDLWNSWEWHQKRNSPWVKWYRKNILYGLYRFNQLTKKMKKRFQFADLHRVNSRQCTELHEHTT